MPTAVKSEALAKEDKPLYKFSIEKESNGDWVDAEQEEPVFSPTVREESFINTSSAEKKVLAISRPAYDIDEEYRSTSKSLIFLPFFTSCNYRLKKPLLIIIEQGINPDIFIIGNEELNKYGIGSSKEEALKEFEDFIIADYRTLKESPPEQLSEDAKELLTLYDSYIEL